MDMDLFWSLTKLILGIIIGITLIIFGFRSCDINVVNVVPIKAYVDNKLVYEGKSGCLSVASTGRTTALTVNGGFLCLYPQKEYVSDNVHIEGVKTTQ